MNVGVLLTGSELLDGRVGDTNARWIGQQLASEGVAITEVVICGDDTEHIVSSLKRLASMVEIIIVSGGIGPTTDDCTREAIAEFFGVPLICDDEVLSKLKALYAERKRVFHENSIKQAMRPKGALLIENDWGTASCFEMQSPVEGKLLTVISLPGVPLELTNLCTHKVFPRLFSRLSTRSYTRTFSTFGMPEASIGAIIEKLDLPPAVNVAYRAAIPEIHLKLRSHDEMLVGDAAQKVQAALDDIIFSVAADEFLPECLGRLFAEKKKRIFTKESFTGGKLSELLSRYAGECFVGGVVGSVPIPTEILSSDMIVVAVNLESTAERSASVCVVITHRGEERKTVVVLSGDCERIKSFATHTALDQLRRYIIATQGEYGRSIDPPR